jgi:hypothetical protein
VPTRHLSVLLFMQAKVINRDDATVDANMSLCFLKMRNGMQAVHHAKECQRLRPRWAKAWFREGEVLSLLKVYIATSHHVTSDNLTSAGTYSHHTAKLQHYYNSHYGNA